MFIGCNHTLAATLLPSLLASFHQQQAAVHLHVKVDHSDTVITLVERGTVEVGFIYDPAVRSEGVLIKELFRQPLQVLVPLDQPFTQMEAGERTLERIVAEPLLLQGEGARLRKVLEHRFLRRGLSVGPIMEIESIEGLKELVKRGCGVTLMPPAFLWSPQMRDGLELLPIADVAEMFIFALVYRRITPLTITARQFIKGAIETTAAAVEALSL